MDFLTVADAASLAGVSTTTLRNYIKDKRLTGYEKGGRTVLERHEILSIFGAKPLASRTSNEGTRIIAIANQKGGVGKTTSAVALTAIFARDVPVLAVDCDPQGNMTQAFGYDPDGQDKTLYNVLV